MQIYASIYVLIQSEGRHVVGDSPEQGVFGRVAQGGRGDPGCGDFRRSKNKFLSANVCLLKVGLN